MSWSGMTFAAAGAFLLAVSAPPARSEALTFKQRVDAQRAIDRIYYSHQTDTTRPFDEAVPLESTEAKVRKYLKESVALETFWKTPLTSEMLRREVERMARGTRLPDRLRELLEALEDDPLLI